MRFWKRKQRRSDEDKLRYARYREETANTLAYLDLLKESLTIQVDQLQQVGDRLSEKLHVKQTR